MNTIKLIKHFRHVSVTVSTQCFILTKYLNKFAEYFNPDKTEDYLILKTFENSLQYKIGMLRK